MTKKILIVDDHFEDIENIQEILKKSGYECYTATNGAQALDLIKDKVFDLITIDLKMPTVSGYDLLQLLRVKYNGKIKMIYVTIIPKKEVDLSNVNGFVQKPFSAKKLLSEVKRVLR